jgi:hypothetical protein
MVVAETEGGTVMAAARNSTAKKERAKGLDGNDHETVD